MLNSGAPWSGMRALPLSVKAAPAGFPQKASGDVTTCAEISTPLVTLTACCRLSEAELKEIDAAVRSVLASGSKLEDVGADEFPLPTLGPVLQVLHRVKANGRVEPETCSAYVASPSAVF